MSCWSSYLETMSVVGLRMLRHCSKGCSSIVSPASSVAPFYIVVLDILVRLRRLGKFWHAKKV